VLARFEDLEEANDVRMLYFLEQVHLLEHLTLTEVILHELLLNCLDRHIFARQLVHSESHFTEGALADQFDEFVKLEGRRGQLIILRYVILDVADQLVSLLEEALVDSKLARIGFAAMGASRDVQSRVSDCVLGRSFILGLLEHH